MLKIRLTRRGKKNRAFFRLVVAEHTAPIKGRFLEALGFLNPHTKEKNLKADRIKYWLEKGAQCSDTVHNLLVKEGILEGSKRAVKMKKKEKSADDAEKAEVAKKEEEPAYAKASAGEEEKREAMKEKEEKIIEKKDDEKTEKKDEEEKTEKIEEKDAQAEEKAEKETEKK